MSKELIYIRFLQISCCLLTIVLFYSVSLVKKNRIDLHKKINTAILIIVMIAVAGLLGTIAAGFNYQSIPLQDTLINLGPDNMKDRLFYHRLFSTPLFFVLIATGWTGFKRHPLHKTCAMASIFFWLGCLTTALIFF